MKSLGLHDVTAVRVLGGLSSSDEMGRVYADGYGEVRFEGDLGALEPALRQGGRPLADQAGLVAEMVKMSNGVEEFEGLLALHGRLTDAAERQRAFVEKIEADKKSVHNISTNAEKRRVKEAHSAEIFAPEPVYIEGIVDKRWLKTADMLTGEFRMFEADRREDLLVAMGAKAGRLKTPLVYLGNDVYALCHVVQILMEAGAWGGGSRKEVCRRIATCIVKTDGGRIQGESIRTSIPKEPRKRRSLSSTYAPLRTLWNVE